MMKYVKDKKIWLTAAAIVLAGGMSLPGAMAYFTTYTSAEGSQMITLGHQTEVEEDFNHWTKKIQIVNSGEVECYVRVKVFAGNEFTLDISGQNWTKGDGDYYYYAKTLAPGEVTEDVLDAHIQLPADEFKEAFNVAVVQECTPVQYDEQGNPKPADWSLAVQETIEKGVGN